MVRTNFESGALSVTEVGFEANVDEVASFAGLHVRERDVVARHCRPVDDALMARNVDPVALSRLKAGSMARNVEFPSQQRQGSKNTTCYDDG